MLIKGGLLVDHRSSERKDIIIEDGIISEIGSGLSYDGEIIDATNLVVMPSFIDLHAHFRDPGFTYKEDLESGSRAALKGGYTVCYAMANTKPVCDNIEIYKDIIKRSEELDLIDFYQNIAATKGLKGEEIVDLDNLPEKVKFISDDGKGIQNNKIMFDICHKLKEKNIGIMIHAEESELSPSDYRVAEDIMTFRDVYLAIATSAKMHFSHVSTLNSLDIIRYGKKMGANITCEITPHHIAMHDSDYRVNPPIRMEKDIKAIIEAIKDDTVDAISTDHAPHSKEDKEKGSPGMVGLEVAFMISYSELVKKGHISLEKLSEIMSYRPGKILGLNHGEINVGARADLVLVDLEAKELISEGTFASKSKNSPFIGKEYYGKIMKTIRKGRIMYENNR